MQIILASSSARRRQILEVLGVSFRVISPYFVEIVSADRPVEEEVLEFALRKASSVAREHPGAVVIGADTLIALGEKKIGKPADRAEAKEILLALRGKRHRIFTGVAIVDEAGGPGLRHVERVEVKMRGYSEEEVERYLDTGESLDKAGAYSIQGGGRNLIESIEGDYLAAVGLPLRPIARYLRSRGVPLREDVEQIYAEKRFPNWSSFP
ncbi:MAG TPA: Maf family protein [candidate division Zixibacteria bacterium]|nr:Maf family protein [candidate division Zixibacteria bacterium]